MAPSHGGVIVELVNEDRGGLQAFQNERLPLGKAMKRFPKVVYYTLGLMGGVLFVGYDAVIVGTVTALPWFQRDFGNVASGNDQDWILPASWIALWSAITPLGAVLGGVFAGWFQDRAGRKWSLRLAGIVTAVSTAAMYCSNLPDGLGGRRATFLVSKLLQGLGAGIIIATNQTYVSEIVPVSLRGPAMALFPTFTLLGQLIGALIIFTLEKKDSPNSYLLSFASQWPFGAFPLVMSFVMPESPTWLLRKDRADEARKSQERLHKSTLNALASLDLISATISQEASQDSGVSYRKCFTGSDRRRTYIVILANLVPASFGLPLLASASYFMQQVGMDAPTSLLFLIIGIILGFAGNGFGIWILSKAGRRFLILTSMTVTTILWFAMGISGIWHGNATMWFTALTMMVVIVVCGIGAWPATFAVGAEVSSLRLRARVQGVGVLAGQVGNIVFSLILPYIYNSDAGNLKAKTGFFYAGICAVGTFLCWLLIPEMKDRTAAEIDHMFEMRLRTRGFKQYQ